MTANICYGCQSSSSPMVFFMAAFLNFSIGPFLLWIFKSSAWIFTSFAWFFNLTHEEHENSSHSSISPLVKALYSDFFTRRIPKQTCVIPLCGITFWHSDSHNAYFFCLVGCSIFLSVCLVRLSHDFSARYPTVFWSLSLSACLALKRFRHLIFSLPC